MLSSTVNRISLDDLSSGMYTVKVDDAVMKIQVAH
jgi:hypothetical protein